MFVISLFTEYYYKSMSINKTCLAHKSDPYGLIWFWWPDRGVVIVSHASR